MRSLVERTGAALVVVLVVSSLSEPSSTFARSEVVRVVAPLTPNPDNHPSVDFVRYRQRIGTRLVQNTAAPDLYKDPGTREGVHLTRYPSHGSDLKMWQLNPSHHQLWSEEGYPALIYVHDGTSFSEDELGHALSFAEAGFMVFAPTFRGENGNPGAHELLFGELDDLVAATARVSESPEVDRHRIAIWGHGLGGMLAALSSLVPRLPARYTGSSAGLRPTSAFEVLHKPFEDSPRERSLRAFGPNVHHLRTPHWACVAEEDLAVDTEAAIARRTAAELGLPLQVERVPGNRTTSRATCTQNAILFLLQTSVDRYGPQRR
jgi:acetyl esterase/lipase